MDIIKNIDTNVKDILTNLSNLDVNVDNTPVVDALGDILEELYTLNVSTSWYNVDTLTTIFNATSLPSKPTEGYSCTSVAIPTGLAKKAWIFCNNAVSTNMTILINALATADSTISVPLYTLTLNATTVINGGCVVTELPPFVQIQLINNDTTNSATVTVNIVLTE